MLVDCEKWCNKEKYKKIRQAVMNREIDRQQRKKMERKWAVSFFIVGMVVFEMLAPYLFESSGRFDFEQMLWAGFVGVVSAAIGVGVFRFFD